MPAEQPQPLHATTSRHDAVAQPVYQTRSSRTLFLIDRRPTLVLLTHSQTGQTRFRTFLPVAGRTHLQ